MRAPVVYTPGCRVVVRAGTLPEQRGPLRDTVQCTLHSGRIAIHVPRATGGVLRVVTDPANVEIAS